MSVNSWTGIGSTLYATPGNWTLNAIPVGGDDVKLTGNISLGGSDQSAVDLGSLSAGQAFTGTVGTESQYLVIGAARVSIETSEITVGDMYLDSGATHDFELVDVNDLALRYVHLKGTIGTLVITHGKVVLDGAAVTNVYIQWDGVGNKPQLILNGTTTITNLYRANDCLVLQSSKDVIVANDFGDDGVFTVCEGTVTNYVQRGGTVFHDTNKTTASVKSFGGKFDATRDDRPKTITLVEEFLGGVVDTGAAASNVTVASRTVYAKTPDSQFELLEASPVT